MTAVSETVSKKKRGRPLSRQSSELAGIPGCFLPEGCRRTRINSMFSQEVLCMFNHATKKIQRIVWGCTSDEIMSGSKDFGPGWRTYTPEIGRYIAECDDEAGDVRNCIIDARKRGLSWSDIAAHFRKLRLGEKSGNKSALTADLCRTINQFRKQFPKTSDEIVGDAIDDVAAIVFLSGE